MNKSFSHAEWNKLNGRAKTAARGVPELKNALEDKTGGNKGFRATVGSWVLDPTCSTVFKELRHSVAASQSMIKIDNWVSHLLISKIWTDEELEAQMMLGRIVSRSCPDTPGVWEYKHTNDVQCKKTLDRAKVFSQKTSEARTFGPKRSSRTSKSSRAPGTPLRLRPLVQRRDRLHERLQGRGRQGRQGLRQGWP